MANEDASKKDFALAIGNFDDDKTEQFVEALGYFWALPEK